VSWQHATGTTDWLTSVTGRYSSLSFTPDVFMQLIRIRKVERIEHCGLVNWHWTATPVGFTATAITTLSNSGDVATILLAPYPPRGMAAKLAPPVVYGPLHFLPRRPPMLIELRKPYLLFLGDVRLHSDAKTAYGLRDWCPNEIMGQWTLPTARVDLGLPRLSPRAAAAAGCQSLIVGVAPEGGALPEEWWGELEAALDAGLDLVAGLHTRLTSIPCLVRAAAKSNRRLIDVRDAKGPFTTGNGRKRTGRRLLTVGTDCALGKKYTALAIARALNTAGLSATFRATGQTGIMISGSGIPIDAVVSDFVAGAAEALSPDGAPQHWDVIEGQGSLFHPAYAAVTLGLLHGSQPDCIVLCHDPRRLTIEGYPDFPIPDLAEVIDAYLRAGRLTNHDIYCVGLSINSSRLSVDEWNRYRDATALRLGLPVCDPIRDGVASLIKTLMAVPPQAS
jgi:uncharacterized NAD-dependent epimerase/dehydratase family protein